MTRPPPGPLTRAASALLLVAPRARGAVAGREPRHDPRRGAHARGDQVGRVAGALALLRAAPLPRRRRPGGHQHVGDPGGRARRHGGRRNRRPGPPVDPTARRPVDGGGPPRRAGTPGGGRRRCRRAWRTGAEVALLDPLLPRSRRGRRPTLGLPDRDARSACTASWPATDGPSATATCTANYPIAAYQNVYATEPGSAEMPSAGRPFTPEVLTRLVAKGVGVAPVLLHTGVASLEASEPPYAEYFRVSLATAHRINDTRRSGGRVIAIGTTVVRALESVVDEHGHVHPSEGWTETVVSPDRPVRSIDGFLTGWHEPEASHLAMLEAIAGATAARGFLRGGAGGGLPLARVRRRPPHPAVTPDPATQPRPPGRVPAATTAHHTARHPQPVEARRGRSTRPPWPRHSRSRRPPSGCN